MILVSLDSSQFLVSKYTKCAEIPNPHILGPDGRRGMIGAGENLGKMSIIYIESGKFGKRLHQRIDKN